MPPKLATPAAKAKGTAKPVKAVGSAKAVNNGHDNGNRIAPAIIIDEAQRVRNERGQFRKGDIGGPGRPPGCKNKLTEDFITDFHDAWKSHGRDALETMATGEPGAFVRAAVQLMPKDVLLDARGAGLLVVRLDDTDMSL